MFKKFLKVLHKQPYADIFRNESQWNIIELRTPELLPDDIATLSEIMNHIIPLQDNVDHLLRLITQKAIDIIGASACMVYWKDLESGQWSAIYKYQKADRDLPFVQPVPNAWLEKVVELRRPLIFQPTQDLLLKTASLTPVLCVPLVLPRIAQVEGILCMFGEIVHQSLKRNIQIVNAFASIAAISIENARLFEQIAYETESGTYTRAYTNKRLNEEFHRCRRAGSSMAVVLVDFEIESSSLQQYRQTLKTIGKALQSSIREYDFVGRYSEHTFLVGLMEIEYRDAIRRLTQIVNHVQEKVREKGARVKLTAGAAIYPYHRAYNAIDLLQKASVALFEARNSNKNKIRFYKKRDETMSDASASVPYPISESGFFSLDTIDENLFQSKELLFFILGTLSGEIRKTRKHLLTIRNVCEADKTWKPLTDDEAQQIVLKALYGLEGDLEELSKLVHQLILKLDKRQR